MPALTLSPGEREALERWSRRPKTAQALAQRARIVGPGLRYVWRWCQARERAKLLEAAYRAARVPVATVEQSEGEGAFRRL